MKAADPLMATWHGTAGHSKTWLHTENTPANGEQNRAAEEDLQEYCERRWVSWERDDCWTGSENDNNPREEEHGTGMSDTVLGPVHH